MNSLRLERSPAHLEKKLLSVRGLYSGYFPPIIRRKSEIMLQMDYEPEGVAETLGDTVGAVLLCVSGDLERFKDFIEA